MELLFVILLLFLGIVFILLEIIVFPGISISGIAGVILLCLGIYFSYAQYGQTVGHITLAGTLLIATVATVLAFRYSAWKKVALETELDGKVDVLKDANLQVGTEGITVSRLAPMGSVKIQGRIFEAKCREGYVENGVAVEVVRIQKNLLLVKEK